MRSEVTGATPPPDLERMVQGLARGLRHGASLLAERRRRSVGLRGAALVLFGLPLLPAAIIGLARGDLALAAASAGGLALVVTAVRWVRRARQEQLVAPKRRYTPASRFPFHAAAVAAVAAASALVAGPGIGQGLLVTLVYGTIAAVGCHLAYRLPGPVTARSVAASADKTVQQALQQAEGQLLSIERAANQIDNAELSRRLHRITTAGWGVLEMLAQRPEDLFRARQFLRVHLDGAERVAVRYARTHRLSGAGELEGNFRRVLEQIEQAFTQQRRQLADRDLLDLDVQIAVLRKQLKQEGIA
jgi:hypothetical protein